MKEKILNILQIVIGNICIAFALSSFILEHGIICGGVSGIGIVAEHYFNLPISLVVGIMNVSLFAVGFFILGKEFAMTTLVSTFLFPVLLEVFNQIPFMHGLLDDSLLAMVIAGCLVGIGIGLVMKVNASTGGVDILALALNKKFKIPVHIVLNVIDVTILVFQITFSNTTNIIYGIMMTFITSAMLNKTLSNGASLIQLTVISDSYEEIKKVVLHEMDAGVTMMVSEKGYTNEASKLVMSVIPYRKLPVMKQKILAIDPVAFIIVSKVEEVGGVGFTIERSV